jgi:hypothetical protein
MLTSIMREEPLFDRAIRNLVELTSIVHSYVFFVLFRWRQLLRFFFLKNKSKNICVPYRSFKPFTALQSAFLTADYFFYYFHGNLVYVLC